MAMFFSGLLDKFRGYDNDEDYEDEDFDDIEDMHQELHVPGDAKTGLFRRQNKVVDFAKTGTSGQQVVIIQPSCIESAQEVCNHLRAGRTVICNYEKVDQKIAQRVMDFITGAAYSIDGQVHKVSPLIFVTVPRHISLMDDDNASDTEYVRQTMYATR